MVEDAVRRLETKRFHINSKSRDRINEINNELEKARQKRPWLSGVSFFGSRTKGVEGDSSDMDICLFVNSHKMPGDKRNKHVAAVYRFFSRNNTQVDCVVDISSSRTKYVVNTFLSRLLYVSFKCASGRESESNKADSLLEKSGYELRSRFHLACGSEVYENRGLILSLFEMHLLNNLGFEFVMKYLAWFERGSSQKIDVPEYMRYPKTIAEAREYFNIKKPGGYV